MNINEIRNNVKYLLFDLDGTLINNERTIAKDNVKLANFLQLNNLKHSIITGRPHYMMQKEIHVIKPTLPIVAANGAMILDHDKLIYSELMDQNLAKQLVDFLVKENLSFYLYTPTQIYVFPDSFPHVDKWREVVANLEPQFQWKISSLKEFYYQEPIFKFLVSDKNQDTIIEKLKQNFTNQISLAKSSTTSLDIGNPIVNKGTGFEHIMKILNATPNQFMVFGDGGNDLPMFQKAKYSVALHNAADFVKKAATFITDYDNNASGVYHFIKKIWTN